MPGNENVNLYYREGSSDKVYQIQLEAKDSGFVVNFQYGRRGASLKAGTKTPEPLDYAAAKKVYDKLVKEKQSGGYTPDKSGVAYSNTEFAGQKTQHSPQLLNPVTANELDDAIGDSKFWMQEKFDGERVLIQKTGTTVTGINRRGLVRALPAIIVEACLKRSRPQDFVLDGELIGETFYAFDLIEEGPYSTRLESLSDLLWGAGPNIVVVQTAKTSDAKIKLLADVTVRQGEGVVLKRHDAPYTAGRPASGGPQLKFKLLESASCIVTAINQGKRSIQIHLLDKAGQQVPVGNVAIPANHGFPNAGDVVEVRYMHAYQGGSLFQPFYQGVRRDIETTDCTLDQLKLKVTA